MSGGSFNNVYSKADDSDILTALPDLRELENYLRGIGKHDAADEVLLFIREIETHMRRIAVMGRRIKPLLKAAEYYASSDWGISSIDEAYRNLMGLDATGDS
jgi:hypothetical protein